MGTPVWSHHGDICTGESYKSSLEGTTRQAIDIREGEKLNEAAFKKLIQSAVAANFA